MVMGKQIPDSLAFICLITTKIFQNLHQVQPNVPESSTHLHKTNKRGGQRLQNKQEGGGN